ncbi:MAG: hypothetical protein FWD15_02810 [Alphaproteobacteria bacterium]|nr:hypothetical protein [Alphaproteobacteria bacterium]
MKVKSKPATVVIRFLMPNNHVVDVAILYTRLNTFLVELEKFKMGLRAPLISTSGYNMTGENSTVYYHLANCADHNKSCRDKGCKSCKPSIGNLVALAKQYRK